MTIQSFLQWIEVLFFVIVFSFVIFTQSVHAMLIAKCVPYTFSELYAVNSKTLPTQVEVRTYKDGWQYLINTGSKTLSFHNTVDDYRWAETLILVDEKAVTTYGTPEEHTFTGVAASGAARLSDLVHFNTPRISHASTTRPKQPDSTPFTIPAQYAGEQISITGTLSYKLHEYDCPSGKEVTGEKTDTQGVDKTTMSEPVDTGSQVVPQEVPQKKSFWTTILQFFAFLKFW